MSDDHERAPGWYPDERYPEDERWWDGRAWSTTRPRGDHTVRARSAEDAGDESVERRIRLASLALVPIGIALVYLVYTIYQRG
jgi:hypothetical protein